MSELNDPVKAQGDSGMVIDGVCFPGSSEGLRVSIQDEVIASIAKSDKPVQWVCFPPFADLHMHANRAFSLPGRRPTSFVDSVNMTVELLDSFEESDYKNCADKLFQSAFAHGTTKIRTHVDVDSNTGLKGIYGTIAAKREVSDNMDIDIVSFATGRLDPANSQGQELLRDSIAAGATFLGATPVFYDDPGKSMQGLIDLAIELDVDVDVHLDEHLDPDNSWTEALADLAIANGFIGRITIGHACVLSCFDEERLNRTIDKLAKANVTIISLPLTNLYLQDRGIQQARYRGLTTGKELIAGGLTVLFGTDNVRDAFYPFGDADLLETAHVGMLASQVDEAAQLTSMICNGRAQMKEGDPASMVLVKGQGFDDVISKRPEQRIIIRNGQKLIK